MSKHLYVVLAGIALAAAPLMVTQTMAQTPASGPVRFTATTDNVSGAKIPVRIDLVRWSSDAERDQLMAAWSLTSTPGRGGRGGGRGGRGAGGRGAAPAEDIAPDPAAADDGNFAPAGRLSEVPAATPASSLGTALGKTPTLGYVWASEVAGYAIHGAVRLAAQDGSERIILLTDRRLGATNDLWKPVGSAGPDYPFSVIELRVSGKGEGEGKISLTGKVSADSAAKFVALDNYAAAPVLLRNVKRGAAASATK